MARQTILVIALLFALAPLASGEEAAPPGPILLAAYTDGDLPYRPRGYERKPLPRLDVPVEVEHVEMFDLELPLTARVSSLPRRESIDLRFGASRSPEDPFLLCSRFGRLTFFVDADLLIPGAARTDRPLVDPEPDRDDTFMAGAAYRIDERLSVLLYPFFNMRDMGGPAAEDPGVVLEDYREEHAPHRLALALQGLAGDRLRFHAEAAAEFPLDYRSIGATLRLTFSLRI